MQTNYLIIGQGIAGSLLACFLIKAGKKVFVIDEERSSSASRIASGIINPVTGKRLVKSWRIEELLPFALNTYRNLEIEFQKSFITERKIYRIFSNREDAQFFRQKNETGELPKYVKPLEQIPDFFHASSLGGIIIEGAFQLKYGLLLSEIRKWLKMQSALKEEVFDFKELQLSTKKVEYKDVTAETLIFCEGNLVTRNPFFSWLPFNFVKGETITVDIPGFPQEQIWHKGIFIAPSENGLFKAGSTYDWEYDDEQPTETGKEKLSSRLQKAIKLPFEIKAHQAAIRPAVSDRRPLLGIHPHHPQLAIFNGLGTKGASLAPFFTKQFSDFLIHGKPLESEVTIQRFSL